MCLWQAAGFESIRLQLLDMEIDDIRFMIVNAMQRHAVLNAAELSRRVNFPVYQDTWRSNIWRRLGGGKDDVFIYDRCGQLTRHIPFPASLLNETNFQQALWDAYYGTPCTCYHVPGGGFSPYLPGQSPSGSVSSHSGSSQSGYSQSGTSHQGHGTQHQHGGGSHQHQHQGGHGRHGNRGRSHHHRARRHIEQTGSHKPEVENVANHKSPRCSKKNIFCQIVSSTGLRYRRRYKHVAENILDGFCSKKSHNKHGCICPKDTILKPCFCKEHEIGLRKNAVVTSSLCTCGYLKKKHRKTCFCKTCLKNLLYEDALLSKNRAGLT